MTSFARSVLFLSVTGLAALSGCSASHVEMGDAGARADAAPPLADASPSACIGRPVSPSCVCEGTSWVCPSDRCPSDIDPWDPSSPGSLCDTEGAHCASGTDPCGSAISCDCSGGRWSCLVAEPDPVCSCGREPAAGDRCNEEGASCGECCPTPGGTGWAPMTCVGGHWAPLGCPELVCPPIPEVCPVDGARALGTACGSDHQICGNACCGTAFQCVGGVWIAGPDAACACDPSSELACGDGTCRRDQACTSQCGPADGIEHTCTSLADGCTSCDCVTVPAGYACEARDGSVFLTMTGLCG